MKGFQSFKDYPTRSGFDVETNSFREVPIYDSGFVKPKDNVFEFKTSKRKSIAALRTKASIGRKRLG